MKQWVETAGFVDPVQPPPVSMISPKSITYVSPVRDDPNLLRWFGILDSCSADDKAAVFRMNRVWAGGMTGRGLQVRYRKHIAGLPRHPAGRPRKFPLELFAPLSELLRDRVLSKFGIPSDATVEAMIFEKCKAVAVDNGINGFAFSLSDMTVRRIKMALRLMGFDKIRRPQVQTIARASAMSSMRTQLSEWAVNTVSHMIGDRMGAVRPGLSCNVDPTTIQYRFNKKVHDIPLARVYFMYNYDSLGFVQAEFYWKIVGSTEAFVVDTKAHNMLQQLVTLITLHRHRHTHAYSGIGSYYFP